MNKEDKEDKTEIETIEEIENLIDKAEPEMIRQLI